MASLVVVAIFQLIFEHSSSNIGVALIEAGIALTMAGIPNVLESLIAFIAPICGIENAQNSETYLYVCMAAGFALIAFGIIVLVKLREHIYVLNMVGISKREVSDKKAIKELKLADYKVKEQILDIIPVFGDGQKIDDRANKYIIDYIETDAKKFSDKTNNEKSCFTGMAPIPYTVYAGTYLGTINLSRYFEFNRLDGEFYYELKKKRLLTKKWTELKEVTTPKSNESTEVVLAIGISHSVLSEDLIQFNGVDVIRLEIEQPKDNVITCNAQLLEYKRVINSFLDEKLKQRYNMLKKVHLVAAIPSCVALEIGKSIGMGTNRMPEIVVYHYISSSEKKYPYGIFVSGSKKGKLIKN
jgi:hypothetical protein